jgi:4-hydroxy-tetrahydrodipicolinate synthase
MSTGAVSWKGYVAAAPTPFSKDGKLDLPALDEVVRHLVDAGAHGILINGSTGEWFTQTTRERMDVAERALSEKADDVYYLVGVSSIDPNETFELAQHARAIGADGVLISPPPARRLTQAEIIEYYRTVCLQVPLPVMLYNIPPDVVSDIRPATIASLAAIDNVVAVKDSTPNDWQFLETMRAAGQRMLVFGNLLCVPAISQMIAGLGGDGHVGSGMPLGRRLSDAFEAAWRGDYTETLRTAEAFSQLRSALAGLISEATPWGMHAQVKATMELAGVPAGYPRWPQRSVQEYPDDMDRLRALLRQFDALS